jgi:uncharacterized protein
MTEPTAGSFVWYDLLTTDPAEAVSFYVHVVGWESRPFGPEYTMFGVGEGPVGGATKLPERAKSAGGTPHWTSNVKVADVDATTSEVRKLGGRVLVEPSDSNVGRLAVVADPQGAAIHVFQPSQPMKARDSTRHGEFAWNELLTTDHEAAFPFYAALFGWKKRRDFDMGAIGTYLIFGTGERDLGGMFTKPEELPAGPHWLYYVNVDDLDAAIARARARGAKLRNGPMEVPGGARVARLDDPQGAGFALHEMAKAAGPAA